MWASGKIVFSKEGHLMQKAPRCECVRGLQDTAVRPVSLEKRKEGGEWYIRAVVEGLDMNVESNDFIKEMQIKR